MNITLEIEKTIRTGQNKANRTYHIYSGYACLPGLRHPQLCEFYSEVNYGAGTNLSVPIVAGIEDRKISFRPDFDNSIVIPAVDRKAS